MDSLDLCVHIYLSISGKCNRSARPTSNGLTILLNLDGGVGVFTIGNVLKVVLRARIEFGVRYALELLQIESV